MTGTPDTLDPKGLIADSYRIEGITAGECRSIFLDWALSLPVDGDTDTARLGLIARHGTAQPKSPWAMEPKWPRTRLCCTKQAL